MQSRRLAHDHERIVAAADYEGAVVLEPAAVTEREVVHLPRRQVVLQKIEWLTVRRFEGVDRFDDLRQVVVRLRLRQHVWLIERRRDGFDGFAVFVNGDKL